jgi:hypothetical protein
VAFKAMLETIPEDGAALLREAVACVHATDFALMGVRTGRQL